MKRLVLSIIITLVCTSLCACGCKHEWEEATCDFPQICTLCGKTEGEAKGHEWEEATCTVAKTCINCGATQGEPNQHTWEENGKICSVCGLDERSIDEKFMESLAKGLEKRWALAEEDNKSTTTATKADWEEYFEAEYSEIIKFDNEIFENGNLGVWAQNYIKSIIAAKEALVYFNTNQWNTKYTEEAYNNRVEALYNIHGICPVPVSEEYEDTLIGIVVEGEVINSVRDFLDETEFAESENSYGWTTYDAVVENTTSITFSYFSFQVDLVDEDGVTLSTQNPWADYWEPGEKVRFSFSTNEQFSEMIISHAQWIY